MEGFVIVMTILQVVSFVILARHVLAELAKTRIKNGGGLDKREARLLELYGHLEELMDVFEAYIDEVRQDVEKDRAALTEMSRQAMVVYAQVLVNAGRQEKIEERGELQIASGEGITHVLPSSPQLTALNSPRSTPPKADAPRIVRPAASQNTPHSPAAPNSQLSTLNPEHPSRLSSRDREELGRFATKPQKVRYLMGRGLALEEVARALEIGTGEVRLIAELEK